MLSYLVLAYAVCSIGLLLAYQRTRLFPLYLLKCLWTGFTILAFAWVLAMSCGQSKEYIQHPAGPFSIFIGEPVQQPNGRTVLKYGYPQSLWQMTHTQVQWVIAALFCAWITWGLLRHDAPQSGLTQTLPSQTAEQITPPEDAPASNPRQVLNYAPPSFFRARRPSQRLLFPLISAAILAAMLICGCGIRDALAFLAIIIPWLAVATLSGDFFYRFGGWLLLALLLFAAIPLIDPLCRFDWSRYAFFRQNYHYVWSEAHIGRYFMNSVMVTITTVAMTTLLGAMAAYVLARRRFAGKALTYWIIIGCITVPGILIQVPLFLLIKDWGFTIEQTYRYSFMDSRLGLAVIYTAMSLPFTIYVLAGFFRGLPGTLGEAAVIDGCGQWKTFTDIYLPLALPGIATTGIFNFLGAWNEFNLGMIFMSNPNFKTLPIGMYELQVATQYSSAWAPMFAGIVLLCLPTFVIFMFLQQRIVAGLTAGGLKG